MQHGASVPLIAEEDEFLDCDMTHKQSQPRLGLSKEPTLVRFMTGRMNPWDAPDWNSDDFMQFLERDMEDTRELFKIVSVDTMIPRSPLAFPPACLTFRDVSFAISNRKGTEKTVILEPCSGHFEPGQLIAIMGPSGSGKSTLLDMLAMKKTSQYSGEILVNGHPRDRLFRRIAAYVPQEDVMPQHWRVREALEFNLRLKQHRNRAVPVMVTKMAVDLLLEAYDLGSVQNSYIGGESVRGISGGQRRRVTLARGCAANASLLFCDEPTSGLSATDAEVCVRTLRVVAKKFGITVVVVIHQPRVEVANLFDELVLLTSRPGRNVYNGPMKQAIPYLEAIGHAVPEHANPTDFFLDLATPESATDEVDCLVREFHSRIKARLDTNVDKHMLKRGSTVLDMLNEQHHQATSAAMAPHQVRDRVHAVPFWLQFYILLRRKLSITLRNPLSIGVPVLVPIVQAVVLGAMFQDIGDKALAQQLPFVFILLTVLCFTGMQLMPGVIQERNYMKYDTSEALYSELAFIMAGFCVDIPLALSGALSNIVIMYAFSGLSWDYFGTVILWGILLFLVFDSLFGLIASCSPDAQAAQVISIPFNSIFMLFSGFMVSKATAPGFLRWVFDISPNGYAMQAIVIKMINECGVDPGQEGYIVKKEYGFEDGQNGRGIAVMLCSILTLRTLQVLSLRFLNNIQK